MSDADLLRLVEAESAQHAKIEARATAQAVAAVTGFSGWYVSADVRALSRRLGDLSRSVSLSAAGVTDAYLTRSLAMMLDASPKVVGVLDVSKPQREGVTSYEEVYARAAVTVRYLESTGLSRAEAVARAANRVDAMVRTDIALARRAQARRTLRATPRVTGYRRIIHPELSQSGTCGLCLAASGRVYRVESLMPIHDRCRCTQMPVTSSSDPGLTLNSGSLAAVYEAAGSAGARALKSVRVRVEDHGELGPQLVNAAHRSTNPGERLRAREAAGLPPVRRPDTAALERANTARARAASTS